MRPNTTTEARFYAKVDTTGDCWVWTGQKIPSGYGRFTMQGRRHMAHRAAYTLFVGNIPDGMDVLHRCDNPPCCNPDHLFLGTDADNTYDKLMKGRMARGEGIGMAKLSELDVQDLRQLHASGMSFARLAPLYGVDSTTVRRAVLRIAWRHVR
jgi:hypothetical protein